MTQMPDPNSSPERRYVQKAVDALIQWIPLGGSGGVFVHFFLQQEWVMTVITLPVMVVTAVWAGYTGNFTARLGEIAGERGTQDADALVAFLDRLDRAIRWRFSGTEGQYLKAQASACRAYVSHNEVPLPSGILNPDLDEVYVPLKLSSEFLRNFEGQALPTLPGFGDKPEAILQQMQERPTQQIWDILALSAKTPQFRHLVIKAYGGFGKTTLLRHLTYLYATRPRLVRRRYKAPRLIPVLLYLRTWRDTIAQPDAPALPALITQHHAKALAQGKTLEIPTSWAENLLHTGRLLVMLDGFDEVAEAQRPAVSQWITRQMQAYPNTVFILTSRPTAYDTDYSAERVQTPLAVQPFDEDQRRRFVEQWYLCQERFHRGNRLTPDVQEAAKQRAENLLSQIENRPELESMAENPLMLNMIAMFHRSYPNEQLPQRQAELYSGICKLQLGDRPMAKKVDLPLPAEASQAVLQNVALAMVKAEQQVIPVDALLDLMQQGLADQDETVAPRPFLQTIERVSELLVKKDDGYEFAHRSFQEYLAATQIKDQVQKDPSYEDLLLQNFDNEYWKGTVLLYVAQVNPTNLLRAAYRRSHAAASLAYDCLRVNRRRLDDDLVADIKIRRFGQLEEYLQQGQWREADRETWRLMLQTYGKEFGQILYPNELLNFPCPDLLHLDGLWVKYSQGKFGFSVQKQIYVECGNPLDGEYHEKTWQYFADSVGWCKGGNYLNYRDLKANPSFSPMGELPWVDCVGLWSVFLWLRAQMSCSTSQF
jgi:hypothetical protein